MACNCWKKHNLRKMIISGESGDVSSVTVDTWKRGYQMLESGGNWGVLESTT